MNTNMQFFSIGKSINKIESVKRKQLAGSKEETGLKLIEKNRKEKMSPKHSPDIKDDTYEVFSTMASENEFEEI